jgi:hypothetical protein
LSDYQGCAFRPPKEICQFCSILVLFEEIAAIDGSGYGAKNDNYKDENKIALNKGHKTRRSQWLPTMRTSSRGTANRAITYMAFGHPCHYGFLFQLPQM